MEKSLNFKASVPQEAKNKIVVADNKSGAEPIYCSKRTTRVF